MPLSKYDAFFGGNARKAYAALVKRYGAKRGKQIFYATIAKRTNRRPHG